MDEQERRRQVIDEARANLDRLADLQPRPREPSSRKPVTVGNDSERIARRTIEPEPDPAAMRAHAEAWQAWVRAAIADHRVALVEAIGTEIGELLNEERRDILREVDLKIAQARLELAEKMTATIAAMHAALDGPRDDKGKVTELPGTWPKPRAVN